MRWKSWSSDMRPTFCCAFSRAFSWRSWPIMRACVSSSTTAIESPAFGTSSKPVSCTGVAGPASVMRLPRSSVIARTRPQVVPEKNGSPTFSVPSWIRTVPTDAAADFLPRLEHDALGRHVRVGLEVEDVGGEQDHVQQIVDALLLDSRRLRRRPLRRPTARRARWRPRARGARARRSRSACRSC